MKDAHTLLDIINCCICLYLLASLFLFGKTPQLPWRSSHDVKLHLSIGVTGSKTSFAPIFQQRSLLV